MDFGNCTGQLNPPTNVLFWGKKNDTWKYRRGDVTGHDQFSNVSRART